MTTPVWADGALVDVDTPIVTARDHGLLIGDGVFESLAVLDGRARHLDRHLRRLRRGLTRLGLSGAPDDATLGGAIDELLEATGLVDARVRITVTAGPGPTMRERGGRPTTVVAIDRLPPPPIEVALTIVPWARNERSPLAGIKSTAWADNAYALRHAIANGFDNALFLDSTGRLSECATANVFLVVGDDVRTPSSASGCLAGVVREVLLDRGIATELDLFPADLESADAVFVTTSTTGVVPAVRIDDRTFPTASAAIDRARAALAAD